MRLLLCDDFIRNKVLFLAQMLNKNQWLQEISGILHHSVAVLNLCNSLILSMPSIPSNQLTIQLNELICHGNLRVMSCFEALLRSMSVENVNIRIIEARVGSLVNSCWALGIINYY